LDDPWKFKKKVDTLYTFMERANPNLIKKIIFGISSVGTFKMAQAWNFILWKKFKKIDFDKFLPLDGVWGPLHPYYFWKACSFTFKASILWAGSDKGLVRGTQIYTKRISKIKPPLGAQEKSCAVRRDCHGSHPWDPI
jgi:hypothetical protein